MPSLAQRLKTSSEPEALWKGPEDSTRLGGITQGMINHFLSCRERFRVQFVEGWQPIPRFNRAIEFGNMWHVCEEWMAKTDKGNPSALSTVERVTSYRWLQELDGYVAKLDRCFPLERGEIHKWASIVRIQFPEYVNYWSAHPDVVKREPILQERVFHIPYELPSGRVVYLKGKFDSVDLVKGHIQLKENKTKTKIDLVQMQRQLKFDLQTHVYMTALMQDTGIDEIEEAKEKYGKGKTKMDKSRFVVRGVCYNIVRRDCPIKQHEARQLKSGYKPGETTEAWLNRLRTDYFQADPSEWFVRFQSDLTSADVAFFQHTFLNPFLEHLCCWYDTVVRKKECPTPPMNWNAPLGCYNPLMEHGFSELDEYLANGSTVGLRRVESLFPELQEAESC
jgi:hypothetical protein